MKRFLLPPASGPEGKVKLYGKDFHYLVRVRRLKAGKCFDAILPDGTETSVRILSTVDNTLIGECIEENEKQISPIPPIALFQGLPKGAKMDLIVRQAAEGAISLVAPFESEYSTVKLSKDHQEKVKRWARIVKEARQQSGSSIQTIVREPCNFTALLEFWALVKKEYKRPLGIFFHHEPLEKGTFHGYLDTGPDYVALAVGPEGGFSPEEVSLFLKADFKPLLMGNTVLRTETAALYGAAAVRIMLLENDAWTASQTESCSLKYP